MNKSLITTALLGILLLFSSQQVQAQSNFGFRAGLNIANFNDTPDNVDTDSRTGLMAGAYFNFKVPATPIAIQPEILYSQKGYEVDNATLELDYIEVPVLAKFMFAPGPIQPHVYLGPYVGFEVNSEVTGNNVSVAVDDANTDFGGIVGAGVDLNAGVTKLNIGARYGFGLVDAFDGGQGKNSVFSIVAGITL